MTYTSIDAEVLIFPLPMQTVINSERFRMKSSHWLLNDWNFFHLEVAILHLHVYPSFDQMYVIALQFHYDTDQVIHGEMW